MTTLNVELYDALIAIKVPEKKARAAAATIPASDQLATTKTSLHGLSHDMIEVKADVHWLRRVVMGTVIPLLIAIFVALIAILLSQWLGFGR